jgi:chromosome segregation and condensation protein ScpB
MNEGNSDDEGDEKDDLDLKGDEDLMKMLHSNCHQKDILIQLKKEHRQQELQIHEKLEGFKVITENMVSNMQDYVTAARSVNVV